MAACKAGKEALWVFRFLAALHFRLSTLPVDLRVGNKGAISLTENPEFHRKTKHIELRYHWIQEKVESNKIQVSYLLTKDMIADELTKPLNLQLLKVPGDDGNELTLLITFAQVGVLEFHGNAWNLIEMHRFS